MTKAQKAQAIVNERKLKEHGQCEVICIGKLQGQRCKLPIVSNRRCKFHLGYINVS